MIHSLIIGALYLMLSLSGSSAAKPHMVDPFFGIEYDPAEIHFSEMPQIVRQKCPRVNKRYSKAWIYGHLKTRTTEYFILYGYINVPSEQHAGTSSPQLEDDDGLLVSIHDSKCRTDQWQYTLRREKNPAPKATPITASDTDLNDLSDDLLVRYAKAFGGKKEFLNRVTPESRKELPEVVRRRLESYEKE